MAWAIPNYTATTTAGAVTWQQWVQQPVTSNYIQATSITNGSITVNNTVWDGWQNVGYTTINYAWQDEVWGAWIEDDATREEMQRQRDELQARREQQSRERLAREQERQELYLVAHARALDLLDELLTPEEREYRREHQRIQIEGSDGNLYWLETHRETVHGNIVRVDEHGCHLGRACVAPGMYDREGGALPTADGWVGQYLGLKFDAEEFLLQANWSGRYGCRQRVAA